MTFPFLDKIIFPYNTTIREILERFDQTAVYTEGKGFAIINDKKGKCMGVVTDGDIRSNILKSISLDEPIEKIVNKNFIFVKELDTSHQVLRQFDRDVVNLPVLNKSGYAVDLYRYSKFLAASRSEQRIIRARVPVRMSYSGGGTDMSEYINQTPAMVLSSTINKYCTASVIMRDDDEIHIKSKDLNLVYSANSVSEIQYGDKLDLIKAAIKIMRPEYGFNLETYAEFEPGTGLGGSSAVVVAVIGALNYFRNERQLDIYQIADLAYQIERIEMNMKGGWQDQYATAFGGFSWIEFRKTEVVVNPILLQRDTILELEYNLMLFRLGKTRESSKIQLNLIQDIKKNDKLNLFSKMISIAKKMKEALLKGEVKTFADLLHESWVVKRSMNEGVTNNHVEDCYITARKLGALGGKLLGAGDSGYLLIYTSPLYQKKIKQALSEKGVLQENFKFSQKGLEVWSTKR